MGFILERLGGYYLKLEVMVEGLERMNEWKVWVKD